MKLSSTQIDHLLQNKISTRDLIVYHSILSQEPTKEALKRIPRATYYLARKKLQSMGWLDEEVYCFLVKAGEYYRIFAGNPAEIRDCVKDYTQGGEILCECLGEKRSEFFLGTKLEKGWFKPTQGIVDQCIKRMEQYQEEF